MAQLNLTTGALLYSYMFTLSSMVALISFFCKIPRNVAENQYSKCKSLRIMEKSICLFHLYFTISLTFITITICFLFVYHLFLCTLRFCTPFIFTQNYLTVDFTVSFIHQWYFSSPKFRIFVLCNFFSLIFVQTSEN